MTTMTTRKIKTALSCGLLVAAVVALFCSCGRRAGDGRGSLWALAGAEADSVTAALDRSARGDYDPEVVDEGAARLGRIADSLRRAGDTRTADLLTARRLYWQGYAEYMADCDSMLRLRADSAMTLMAGSEAPYDSARIAELHSLTLPHDTLRARVYSDCLRRYKAEGDTFRMVVMYNRIGMMMSAMQNLRDGSLYFKKAAELTPKGTRQDFINSFNLFRNACDLVEWNMTTAADSTERLSLARTLKDNRLFDTRPPGIKAQIYFALYDADGKKAWLDSAVSITSGTWRAISLARLGRHYMKEGMTDSLGMVVREVMSEFEADRDNLSYQSDITGFLRDYFASVGDKAGSEEFGKLFDKFATRTLDEINDYTAVANVFSDNELKMAHIEFGEERTRHRRLLRLWIAAGVVTALVLGGVLIVHQRKRRRLAARQRELDAERRRAGELLHEISDGEAPDEAWSKFSVLFSNAHPGFISKLTALYPELTTGDVRMACYIMAGVEPKQIARALNITPASVTKNRHRLRARLQLHPDRDIAVFLREL